MTDLCHGRNGVQSEHEVWVGRSMSEIPTDVDLDVKVRIVFEERFCSLTVTLIHPFVPEHRCKFALLSSRVTDVCTFITQPV